MTRTESATCKILILESYNSLINGYERDVFVSYLLENISLNKQKDRWLYSCRCHYEVDIIRPDLMMVQLKTRLIKASVGFLITGIAYKIG